MTYLNGLRYRIVYSALVTTYKVDGKSFPYTAVRIERA